MRVTSGTPRCTQYILGQIVYEIYFKFNKDFKGIKIILFHIAQSLLDKLNKTNEDQVIGVNIIRRDIHSVTIWNSNHFIQVIRYNRQNEKSTQIHFIQAL